MARLLTVFFEKRAYSQGVPEWIDASLIFDLYRDACTTDRQHKVNFMICPSFREVGKVKTMNRRCDRAKDTLRQMTGQGGQLWALRQFIRHQGDVFPEANWP